MITKTGELLGVKLDAETAAKVKKMAKDDDRTVSSFLRRMIVKALADLEAPPAQ